MSAPSSKTSKFQPVTAELGENLTVSVSDKGIATFTVDLNSEIGLSGSFKSMMLGKTSGSNVQIPGAPEGYVVNLSAYRKATPTETAVGKAVAAAQAAREQAAIDAALAAADLADAA